jgi:hypothetical protein
VITWPQGVVAVAGAVCVAGGAAACCASAGVAINRHVAIASVEMTAVGFLTNSFFI